MAEALITEPLGPTNDLVSDYTTFLTKEGHEIRYPARYELFRANEAITKYAALGIVAPTTTVPMSVELLDISDAIAGIVFVGIAQHAAAAGAIVRVCVWGVTLAAIDTGDPAGLGDVVIKGASDGTVTTGGTIAGTWDGSDVAGTAFGFFLGADFDASPDLAPVFLRQV